ncbi:hypothetical protein ENBRE01_0914 [Enteropsectra breve]|nr:hypothetical protein ENBRE01_0914 [Enteropsectra breve]
MVIRDNKPWIPQKAVHIYGSIRMFIAGCLDMITRLVKSGVKKNNAAKLNRLIFMCLILSAHAQVMPQNENCMDVDNCAPVNIKSNIVPCTDNLPCDNSQITAPPLECICSASTDLSLQCKDQCSNASITATVNGGALTLVNGNTGAMPMETSANIFSGTAGSNAINGLLSDTSELVPAEPVAPVHRATNGSTNGNTHIANGNTHLIPGIHVVPAQVSLVEFRTPLAVAVKRETVTATVQEKHIEYVPLRFTKIIEHPQITVRAPNSTIWMRPETETRTVTPPPVVFQMPARTVIQKPLIRTVTETLPPVTIEPTPQTMIVSEVRTETTHSTATLVRTVNLPPKTITITLPARTVKEPATTYYFTQTVEHPASTVVKEVPKMIEVVKPVTMPPKTSLLHVTHTKILPPQISVVTQIKEKTVEIPKTVVATSFIKKIPHYHLHTPDNSYHRGNHSPHPSGSNKGNSNFNNNGSSNFNNGNNSNFNNETNFNNGNNSNFNNNGTNSNFNSNGTNSNFNNGNNTNFNNNGSSNFSNGIPMNNNNFGNNFNGTNNNFSNGNNFGNNNFNNGSGLSNFSYGSTLPGQVIPFYSHPGYFAPVVSGGYCVDSLGNRNSSGMLNQCAYPVPQRGNIQQCDIQERDCWDGNRYGQMMSNSMPRNSIMPYSDMSCTENTPEICVENLLARQQGIQNRPVNNTQNSNLKLNNISEANSSEEDPKAQLVCVPSETVKCDEKMSIAGGESSDDDDKVVFMSDILKTS